MFLGTELRMLAREQINLGWKLIVSLRLITECEIK